MAAMSLKSLLRALATLALPVAVFAADTAPAEKPAAPVAPARSPEALRAAIAAAKTAALKDPEFLKVREASTAVIKAEALKLDPKSGDLIDKAAKEAPSLTAEEKKTLEALGVKLRENPVVVKAYADLAEAFKVALLKADPSLKSVVKIETKK